MAGVYHEKQAIFRVRDFFIILTLGLFFALSQCVLTAKIGHSGFSPELTLILAVYVALRSELWVAALAGFFLGLIRDLAGGALPGLWSLNLVMLVWLFYPFRLRLNFFNGLALVPLIFILTLGGDLFVMTPVMAILGWPGAQFNPLPAFFTSSVFTAILAPPVFLFLKWMTRIKEPEDG